MSKWVINGTTVDYNPSKDTGWVYETVVAEHHPPASNISVIQYGGKKAAVRKIEGWTKSASVKAAIQACEGATVTVVDHRSSSASCFFRAITWEEVIDITNLNNTFKYTAELILR